MNAATPAEWLTAAATGAALYLPFVAAVPLAGRDLPDVPATARDLTERGRLLLALARHLETREATR
ncbi:hypothetical protein [Streptomyces sp. enrichment culture]|uniref:hypothetical protein n=1 Tax=Streptomyces sp. enrichment culture TaxID=1795815 RepID=UPI003F54BDEB